MKDLMIPVSIIIAGVFVGGGLYFGGAPASQPVVDTPVAAAPAQPADNTSKVNPVTADDHIRGSLDAQVKIVEYSDFDCPFCSRGHDTMSAIIDKYGDDELAWVYRQFPLEQLHPQAPAVALASECVADLAGNETFWAFTDSYFDAKGSGDKTPDLDLVARIIPEIGVNQADFEACMNSDRLVTEVQTDMNNAVETGGRGTPWGIIIGPTGKTYPINGALPQAAIESLIEVAKQEA